ncbi:hypothetical protein FRUB_08811 [Fimbriiglobus ruber]|uniref:Uncharacterized protein n=1 Tax=Fimbriiglobus ruber TaxID=1908690 RepID=A0A225DCI2_9BACT|nr:hypothetical protein FRUB_08811 [Fimbriiglobus ruber]
MWRFVEHPCLGVPDPNMVGNPGGRVKGISREQNLVFSRDYEACSEP